jgi:RES domain-containing protein
MHLLAELAHLNIGAGAAAHNGRDNSLGIEALFFARDVRKAIDDYKGSRRAYARRRDSNSRIVRS